MTELLSFSRQGAHSNLFITMAENRHTELIKDDFSPFNTREDSSQVLIREVKNDDTLVRNPLDNITNDDGSWNSNEKVRNKSKLSDTLPRASEV
jgi:hypothetical protein